MDEQAMKSWKRAMRNDDPVTRQLNLAIVENLSRNPETEIQVLEDTLRLAEIHDGPTSGRAFMLSWMIAGKYNSRGNILQALSYFAQCADIASDNFLAQAYTNKQFRKLIATVVDALRQYARLIHADPRLDEECADVDGQRLLQAREKSHRYTLRAAAIEAKYLKITAKTKSAAPRKSKKSAA